MQDTNRNTDKQGISYEKAKELAAHQDSVVRSTLARRTDLPPEILYYLASDPVPEVRSSIALNELAPGQASLLLAKDDHAGVRSDLAVNIASQPPRDIVRRPVSETAIHTALRILARDQVPQVREVLADTIKDVLDAPTDVVKTLATDSKLEVCGPVLEHSPVLDEDDLIAIVESHHAPGALNFISRRKLVQERLSDAIVDTQDVSAIADLLSNHGAQIRENTLDDLVDQAEQVELWHAPMCGRPTLSAQATKHLCKFVAEDLAQNLQRKSSVISLESEPPGTQDFLYSNLPMGNVKAIFAKNKLSVDIISRALESQDYGFVLAALILRSGGEETTAKKIFSEKSPKGIIGLCTLAELPANLAVMIQQRMGRIAPSEVIKPIAGEPLMNHDEAEWQVGFYANLASKSS